MKAKPGVAKRNRERQQMAERKAKEMKRVQREQEKAERKAQGLDAIPIVEREMPPLD